MTQDIRWIQRFSNYKKAFKNLQDAVELASERELSNLEKQGMIQAFEFTYELAWNTIKDFFEYKGETDILGSRDAFQLAFKRGLVANGKDLLSTIKSRQLSSHTYHEEYADKIYNDIMTKYCAVFGELKARLEIEEKKES